MVPEEAGGGRPMKGNAWLPVAQGAVDARNVLRTGVLPAVSELARIAPEGRARDLVLRIQDSVYAAIGRLTVGLKARGAYAAEVERGQRQQ